MSETTIPVAEAAKDFLRVLDLVERKGEPAVLVRDGKRVATLSPAPVPALNCAELADRWAALDRLPPEEARAFADDLEQARSSLGPETSIPGQRHAATDVPKPTKFRK